MQPSARLRASLLTALATAGFVPACAITTGATDAGVTPDVQNPGTDAVAVGDAPASMDVSVPRDVVVPMDVVSPMDVVVPTDVPPLCPGNVMPSMRCMSPAESVRNVMFPPGKWVIPDGGRPVPDGAVLPSGCARAEVVSNDCCNLADALREEGGMCCYSFCNQGCCGRPLRIDGRPRVAHTASRGDWGAAGPVRSTLDDGTRAALASAWCEDAQMEHASIAAFARFTLELISLGAPSELVADAQRAGLDEVDHARRCFALAAHHGAGELGPAPMDLSNLTLASSLEDCLDATIVEGCIGETLSALLADAQRAQAADPAARESLTVIAADESRHAALAWRFVAWALRSRPDLRSRVAEQFASALCAPLPRPSPEPVGVDTTTWNAHGRLTAAQAERVLHEGVREVLRPCLAALLGETTRRPEAPQAISLGS